MFGSFLPPGGGGGGARAGGRGGGTGGGGGPGGEMTQALYAHMNNKRKMKKNGSDLDPGTYRHN
jgi:hypothetical protein